MLPISLLTYIYIYIYTYRMYFSEILYKDDLYNYNRQQSILTSYSSYSSFHEYYGTFTPHTYKAPIDAKRNFIIHKIRDFPTEHRIALSKYVPPENSPPVVYKRNLNQYDLQGYFKDVPYHSFHRDGIVSEQGGIYGGDSETAINSQANTNIHANSNYMKQLEQTAMIKELIEEQTAVHEQLIQLGMKFSQLLRLHSDIYKYNVLCSEYGVQRISRIYSYNYYYTKGVGEDDNRERKDMMFNIDHCVLANMTDNVYNIDSVLYSTIQSLCK